MLANDHQPRHRLIGDPSSVIEHGSLPGAVATFPVLGPFNAHRRLRGPYTGTGSMLRRLVPDLLRDHHDLAVAHDTEIRTIAPELRSLLPGTRETLTSMTGPDERTRFYPGAYSLRLAHGVTDLLLEVAVATGPRSVVFTDVDEADPTDLELLAVLWRRAPAHLIELVLATRSEKVPAELEGLAGTGPELTLAGDVPAPAGDGADLAAWYVGTECLSPLPRARAAYEALPAAARAALHDRRAELLAQSGEPGYGLGAIPFHRERGTDPARNGWEALHDALEHCVMMGFYDATIELGERCSRLVDWGTDPERCWQITAKVCTALTALGRPDEAAERYELACASTTLPYVHIQAAYGRAMLFTRFYDPSRRDHHKARAAINTAISISSLLPEEESRLFNLTFNENGLALIAMHLGNPEEALALVTDGLERLDAELGPEAQTLHRSVLRYNRAQLLGRMGRVDDALREYDAAIRADPHHSEYYLERADLHRKRGDLDAALADYGLAIALSPPYPEPHYNRGDLLFELGEFDGAVAEFSRVLDLEPSMTDARANRAAALCQLGRTHEAGADVEAGLATDARNPHLHCLQGTLLLERGDLDGAERSLQRAVEIDPTLAGAWANLGSVAYQRGELHLAEQRLARALELGDDPIVRENHDTIVSVLQAMSAA